MKRLIQMAWFAPLPLRKVVAPLLRAVMGARSSRDAARKAVAAWLWPDALPHPYFFTRALFPIGAELSRLIEPRFRPSSVAADGVTLEPTWLGWLERAADGARKLEGMSSVSWLEMRSYMAGTVLRDTDAVGMGRSLGGGVPPPDTPLLQF